MSRPHYPAAGGTSPCPIRVGRVEARRGGAELRGAVVRGDVGSVGPGEGPGDGRLRHVPVPHEPPAPRHPPLPPSSHPRCCCTPWYACSRGPSTPACSDTSRPRTRPRRCEAGWEGGGKSTCLMLSIAAAAHVVNRYLCGFQEGSIHALLWYEPNCSAASGPRPYLQLR